MGDSATFPGQGAQATEQDKGKEKAVEQPQEDVSMGEEEDDGESSSEESAAEEEVGGEEDEPADDNLEPISTDNIISGGRRTRGKTIDYSLVNAKGSDDEMDDDDDGDFEVPAGDDTAMRG